LTLTPIEIVLGFVCLIEAVAIFVALVTVNNWMQRYERFRRECGIMFHDHQEYLANHDMRLQKLGSPSQRGPIPATADLATVWDRRS
jgi:hypothetical protein